MNYLSRASGEFARRLDLTFTITEPTMPPLPQDGAVEMEDTPELRRELHAAYARFHASVQNRDIAAYRAQMDAPLRRTALEVGYGDTSTLLERIIEFSPFGAPCSLISATLTSAGGQTGGWSR